MEAGPGSTRRLISSGSTFEREIGYSRAVVDGEWIFVSGTTGFDYRSMTISDDVVEQTTQTLANIADVLATAGATFRDVVRVRYFSPTQLISKRAGRPSAPPSQTFGPPPP